MTDILCRLDAVRATLPSGAELAYEVSGGELTLGVLYLPEGARGEGTRLMASILAHADAAGLRTTLLVDPTDEPGDPSSFELARWYARFGFEVVGVDEWMRPTMARGPRGLDFRGLLADYGTKRSEDLSREAFEALVHAAPAARGP